MERGKRRWGRKRRRVRMEMRRKKKTVVMVDYFFERN
jgi:hypothetical protein